MGQRFVCRVYGEVPIGSAAWRREEGGGRTEQEEDVDHSAAAGESWAQHKGISGGVVPP